MFLGLKKRLKKMFGERSIDKRRAKLLSRRSTRSVKVVKRGEIGSRIAFISTFWAGGHALLTPFTLGAELTKIGFSVVVIVTSDRSISLEPLVRRLEAENVFSSSTTIISRDNVGKDFGGFKDAFDHFQAEVNEAERVFIGNDSLLGPLFASDYFERLRDAQEGLWGPTESFDRAYHLQSSHLLFSGRQTVGIAQAFFRKYKFFRNRDNIVRYGEINLTQWCLRQNCRVAPIYPTGQLTQRKRSDVIEGKRKGIWLEANPQHFYFDALLAAGFPFVKRELLTVNPLGLPKHYDRVLSQMDDFGQSQDLLFQHFRPV